MATYTSGGVRRATRNTVTAMRKSAERRQCPNCLRRSALKSERFTTDDGVLMVREWCRWIEQPRDSIYRHCTYDETRELMRVWPKEGEQ